jgi:hypothetical protein
VTAYGREEGREEVKKDLQWMLPLHQVLNIGQKKLRGKKSVMEKGEKGEFHGVMVSHGKRREAYKKRN